MQQVSIIIFNWMITSNINIKTFLKFLEKKVARRLLRDLCVARRSARDIGSWNPSRIYKYLRWRHTMRNLAISNLDSITFSFLPKVEIYDANLNFSVPESGNIQCCIFVAQARVLHISSLLRIQFFMQNPNLQSELSNACTQRRYGRRTKKFPP